MIPDSVIANDVSKWLHVIFFVYASAYFASMFLFLKLIEKKLGTRLFEIKKINHFLVGFSSLLLVIGVSIFASELAIENPGSMIEKIDLVSSFVFLVCVAVFPALILMDRVEIREHGVIFIGCKILPEVAIAKKRNIESLILDSPRNILRMTYKTSKGETKEIDAIVKESYIVKLSTILNQFGLNSSGSVLSLIS